MQEPDDHDDFVENHVTEHEGKPLHAAALCPKCRQIKPLTAFKRALTPAEAKSKGYSGQRQVIIETENCNACRPRRRRKPESFTTAELRKKADAGEIPVVLADMIEASRKADAARRQKAVTAARWDKRRVGMWQALVDGINAELEAVRQQQKYARSKQHTNSKVLDYAKGYCEQLVKVRADLNLEKRRATRNPEHPRWQDYFTHYERNIVAGLWADIPFKLRESGMRRPGLFATDRTEKIHVPPPLADYAPPKPDTEPTPPGWPLAEPEPKPTTVVDWEGLL